MRQRIQRYCDSRSDASLYQSVRNMSQFVSDDYGNRFLVELIQNAHDAHLAGSSDGEVSIVLDPDDGQFGSLYVANRGNGFISQNLQAITNIALSSKPANAGIGNKGLGFRSVLQICSWPEIYSVNGIGGTGVFDGYCFRFATRDDLKDHLGPGLEELAEEMSLNLPCWHVPVPASPSSNVLNFATAGFATVVRLPLKSSEALQTVHEEIALLIGLQTPLHLFLSRVERISIDPGTGIFTDLKREVLGHWQFDPKGFRVDTPVFVEKILLGVNEYAVAHWDIDEATFRPVLDSSIDKGGVPESWRAWQGAARVSVAVPLGLPLEEGRLYCFLPLGSEGRAPFPGYINANFYTKMDRRTVDPLIPLNALFLTVAAWLSCQFVTFLVKQHWEKIPSAAVSLICWEDAYIDALKRAFGDEGKGMLTKAILPVRGAGGTEAWASPKETYGWSTANNVCLSSTRICEVAGARLLTDSLTLRQREELDRIYSRLRGTDFRPPPNVVAEWIEKIAIRLHLEGASSQVWATFYDEISVALAGQPAVLFGKRFLLSVNGDLIFSELPAGKTTGRARRAADVYFAPVMSVDTDVDDEESKRSLPLEKLPGSLRKGFALLNREIPWLKEDGGHRPGRTFLISGKLAREYDTRDVLRTLAGVTRGDGPERTKVQALEWAFRLWSSGRSLSEKETLAANFFVPTEDGWITASAAMFGDGWGFPNGKKLQSALRIGANWSPDLQQSLSRLLPEFKKWPIEYGSSAEWARFLSGAGVKDCLRPIGGESISFERTAFSSSLPFLISGTVEGLSAHVRAHWKMQLTEHCKKMFGTRQYRAEICAWRLPGQFEMEDFPAEARRDYAMQILAAIPSLTDEHRSFRSVRADSGSEPHRLPTPLFAFLTGGNWMPVTRPESNMSFVKPGLAWLYNADERPPRFLNFVISSIASKIDLRTIQWLRENAQLGIFNDDRDAVRALKFVTDAAINGITELRDVRRYREIFHHLWTKSKATTGPIVGDCIPVMVGGGISAVLRAGGDFEAAYFDDEKDGLKAQLLEEVGEPVFDLIRGNDPAVWRWLIASAPGRIRRISDEPAEVFIDGTQFNDSMPTVALSDLFGPWIIDFFVCIAEHKGTSFYYATQSILSRIRRAALKLKVIVGREIQIAHGGQMLALPPALRGSLSLSRADGGVLIIQSAQAVPSLDLMAGTASQLAVALGARELSHGLDASLLRLAGVMSKQPDEPPDDFLLAKALGITIEEVKRTRRLTNAEHINLLDFALPLAACVASPETTSLLRSLTLAEDPSHEELRIAFETLAGEMGISIATLEERVGGLADLRELQNEFGLPIARLNAAIMTLGLRNPLLSNCNVHRDTWTRHLRLCQPAALEIIRLRCAGTFDRFEKLDAYVAGRSAITNVPLNIEWFTEIDELSEALMDEHLTAWIDQFFPADPGVPTLDANVSECRALNGARVRDFYDKFAPILSAWLLLPSTNVPSQIRQTWGSPNTSRENFLASVRDGGWIDFRTLDNGAIVLWLSIAGLWPEGRIASIEIEAWGLSKEVVVSNEERVKAEKADALKRKTEVQFDGVGLSALRSGYGSIAEAVKAAIGQATALQKVASTDARLTQVEAVKPTTGSGVGTNWRMPKQPENAMSDEQKSAIGLIGELWAREWIRLRHNLEEVDESNWVSGYRDSVLNSNGGDDTLGYDFVVATKSRSYYYEVKASTGDPSRFEMGPTEIFSAQRFRADKEHRYRILYLANVGDPSRMSATLLINPFSQKGEGKFRSIGRGSVTYEFIADA
ncbi:sacsin N-terminal ATP-binding-like domain-containing protein [Janthinobacterium lividum]|uniref:sacsin N-terminal ATP-binding-like domain-containing protein n=1 Tax=Janthinobacterium lividum TaxID=29581 RepID=UPI0013768304|nr:DUF3883 domain-containing protein [Janthinobacterium lividum]